jgi:nitrous oxidase accessory protein NosD
MRRWFTAVVVLLGMAGTGLAAVAPAASAASTACLVADTNADHSYTSLQDAVDAAAPGDTLFVKGTCTGTTTISKNLTISGQSASGTKTATLKGGRQGSVLTINNSGGSVTLNTLIITNGGALLGGGILNGGTVTLNGSTITGNTTSGDGGGILSRGTVIMSGTSTVHDNTAIQGEGGGICNSSSGTLVGAVAGANVYNNAPDNIFNGLC